MVDTMITTDAVGRRVFVSQRCPGNHDNVPWVNVTALECGRCHRDLKIHGAAD